MSKPLSTSIFPCNENSVFIAEMQVLRPVITVGRDLLKPPAHPSLFTNHGIKARNLDFRHKRKPPLLALETNTLGAVETNKAEYRTERAYN